MCPVAVSLDADAPQMSTAEPLHLLQTLLSSFNHGTSDIVRLGATIAIPETLVSALSHGTYGVGRFLSL